MPGRASPACSPARKFSVVHLLVHSLSLNDAFWLRVYYSQGIIVSVSLRLTLGLTTRTRTESVG